MNGKYVAAAVLAVALPLMTSAFAAPTSPPVGTLTMPAPFGSSQVLAWSWGASNSSSAQQGAGSGVGKANIQDLSITRYADGQSPLIFKALARGEHLPNVVLVDGTTTVTLRQVLIVSYSTGNSSDVKNTTRIENVTFNFAEISMTVNGVTTCFSISTSTSC